MSNITVNKKDEEGNLIALSYQVESADGQDTYTFEEMPSYDIVVIGDCNITINLEEDALPTCLGVLVIKNSEVTVNGFLGMGDGEITDSVIEADFINIIDSKVEDSQIKCNHLSVITSDIKHTSLTGKMFFLMDSEVLASNLNLAGAEFIESSCKRSEISHAGNGSYSIKSRGVFTDLSFNWTGGEEGKRYLSVLATPMEDDEVLQVNNLFGIFEGQETGDDNYFNPIPSTLTMKYIVVGDTIYHFDDFNKLITLSNEQ